MKDVTWINTVCLLDDEASKVIFIFFRILIVIWMIIWLWVIVRDGKMLYLSICVALRKASWPWRAF